MIVRQVVDRSAALLVIPNSTFNSRGQNFSFDEKRRLTKGEVGPVVDRLRSLVEKEHKDGVLVLYGPSQAAVTLSAFAGHPDTSANATLTMVEPPHIQERSRARLAYDFLTSGAKLEQNITANFSHI
jgi:hypothetical protein